MNFRHGERQAADAIAVLREIIATVEDGRPADKRLSQLFAANRKWGARDRRFTAQIVYSFFRWRGWLCEINLPLAAALAYALDAGQPDPAQTCLAGNEMPCWGILPLGEKMSALAAMTGKTLAIEMLVPDWLKPCVAALSERGYNQLVESFQTRPPTWIRACEGHLEEVFAALQEHEAAPRRHDRLPNAIAFDGGASLIEIRRDTGPVFEVQDIASQAVGHVCKPKPGERWWDVCAASGGKALHLADLMRDRGEIIATDIRESALEQLAARAEKSGYHIIKSRQPGENPEGLFDGVLVDAPCSGIGTWPRNPDMRWRTTEEDVRTCSEKQIEILLHAADFVKPAGTLVYSVCTVTQSETTGIVEKFLSARGDFEPGNFANPLAVAKQSEAGASVLSLLPDDGPGDGMFIAKFRRRS